MVRMIYNLVRQKTKFAQNAQNADTAKVCRSTNVNYLENTNEEQQEETEIESTRTDTDPVAYAEFTTNNGWENYQIDEFSVMAISESFEIKNTKRRSEDDLNSHIVKLKTNTTELFAIADSGSPMSFPNEKTVQRIQQNDQTAVFKNIPPEDTARNLACYNGETIHPKGRLIVTIESGGWKVQTSPFIIVDNHKANIIGRNLLPRIGIKLIQDKQTQRVLTVQRSDESNHEIEQWVKANFQQLCVRIGKSKHHVMKTQFNKDFEPVQQKGRRIPTHLQERVEAELNNLIDQKHIIKLDKCSDKQFISPIVITVKKDQTVKLALDSKKIIKYIHKNKYQMPNIDLLLDNIAQMVKSDKSNQTLFTTLDLRYAYSQIPLDKTTREQCNFSLIGGNATGT